MARPPRQTPHTQKNTSALQATNGIVLVKLAALHTKQDKRDVAYLLPDRAKKAPDAEYLATITRAGLLIGEKRFSESRVYMDHP